MGDQLMAVSDTNDGITATLNSLLELSRNNVISTSNLSQQFSDMREKTDRRLYDANKKIDTISDAVVDLAGRMTKREQNETISTKQRGNIRDFVNMRIRKILGLRKDGGKYTVESKKIRKVYGDLFYSRIYKAIERRFEVSTYQDIRAIDYDEAKAFIESWNYEGDDGNAELMREAEENWAINHPEISVNEYLGRFDV